MSTTLKPQAMDATTRLASKVITATRDMTAASGDVAYTGVGFKPTSIIITGAIDGQLPVSVGFTDSAKNMAEVFQYSANQFVSKTIECVAITVNGTDAQVAVIKSYDSDGFTLTWTKTGSPTGTGKINFLCLR